MTNIEGWYESAYTNIMFVELWNGPSVLENNLDPEPQSH